MKNTVATIYNPHNQSKKQLINSFVVRLKTFQRLFQELKDTQMENPEQALLIVGQRGMGKTTLLLRLAYAIENDESLNNWMIPIAFAEEQYGVNELYALWEQTAKELEDKESSFIGLADKMDAEYVDDALEYEDKCFQILTESLQKASKKLVLFIDNLGVILQRFSKLEQHRLRERLLSNAYIRIVGASSVVLEGFFDYGDAFFNFFKEKHLKGLNKEETKDLLLKLGEAYGEESIVEIVEKHIGRVEALRRITGGVIRTMVLLFEIFVDNEGGRAFKELNRLIDLTTPLYQDRMDRLSKQHQKIVNVVAIQWDGISTKEIAQKTRLESKKIAAQLKVLQRNGVIQRISTQTKNNLYQLSERFFNIWYLMRSRRNKGKERVLWLVRFFEEWCDVEMLKKRVERHINALKRENYDARIAYYVTEALAQTKYIDKHLQHKLLKTTRDFLNGTDEDLAKSLSFSDKTLYEKCKNFLIERKYNEAIKMLEAIKDKKPNITAQIANIYMFDLRDFEKARVHYLSMAKEYSGNSFTRIGNLFRLHAKDFEKAKEFYFRGKKVGEVKSTVRLGDLYCFEFNDYEKAEYYYLMALNENDTEAIVHLGDMYCFNLKNYDKAKHYYNLALKKGSRSSLAKLGNMYCFDLKNYDKAAYYYNLAVKEGNVKSLIRLGDMYCLDLKDYDKAVEYYLEAGNKGKGLAFILLGHLYRFNYQDFEMAHRYYLKTRIPYGDKCVAWMYYKEKINKTEALYFIQKACSVKETIHYLHVLSTIQLWNNQIQNALQTAPKFLYDKELIDTKYDDLLDFMNLLMAKKQYTFLHDYLTNEKAQEFHLKDRFKPIYYALMHYLRDQYPTEYLRMPPEMKETVEEIIAKVEQMRVDYA